MARIRPSLRMRTSAWTTSADPPSDASLGRLRPPIPERTLSPARPRRTGPTGLTPAIRERLRLENFNGGRSRRHGRRRALRAAARSPGPPLGPGSAERSPPSRGGGKVRVFVSHQQRDAALAGRVAHRLKAVYQIDVY